MGKHTLGPWKAVLQYGTWYVRQDPENWNGRGYQHIATFPADRKGTHYGDMFAANARLVAAAPDLLEACEQALMQAENDECAHGRAFGWGNVLRAAIAKATAPVSGGSAE